MFTHCPINLQTIPSHRLNYKLHREKINCKWNHLQQNQINQKQRKIHKTNAIIIISYFFLIFGWNFTTYAKKPATKLQSWLKRTWDTCSIYLSLCAIFETSGHLDVTQSVMQTIFQTTLLLLFFYYSRDFYFRIYGFQFSLIYIVVDRIWIMTFLVAREMRMAD